MTQIEACWQGSTGYIDCPAELTVAATSLPIGPGPGEVRIETATAAGYEDHRDREHH